MSNKFSKLLTRVSASITRIPDRLSDLSNGEATRELYVDIFATCMVGTVEKNQASIILLPFQASLLTDPVIFITGGGVLVLDHPIEYGIFEFPISKYAHVADLPQKYSLYENRYPRIIACAKKREKIELSVRLNRLMYADFTGPFHLKTGIPS